MEKITRAEEIIKNHVLVSMGAGLVPVPLLDIAAVSAVQLDMIRQLARLYEVPYQENSGKGLVGAITGSTLARVGASLVKAIPGVGTLLGGVSMSILSGASTYAVGHVFQQHFEKGGTFSDFDTETGKVRYQEELEKGKKKAAEWKKEKEEQESTEDPDLILFQKLEKLADLREKGIISEEEFRQMKAELIKPK